MTEHPEMQIGDTHYAAIGRVANAWSTLEFYMDKFIWGLASIADPVGACIAAQLIGPGPRLRAMVALMHLRGADQALIKEMNTFSGPIQGVASERNRWAHDPLFVDDETGVVSRYQVSADRKLVYELIDVDLKQLKVLETKIWATVREFTGLADRIAAVLPPRPDIPLPPEYRPR